jgi:hypothetical protein
MSYLNFIRFLMVLSKKSIHPLTPTANHLPLIMISGWQGLRARVLPVARIASRRHMAAAQVRTKKKKRRGKKMETRGCSCHTLSSFLLLRLALFSSGQADRKATPPPIPTLASTEVVRRAVDGE